MKPVLITVIFCFIATLSFSQAENYKKGLKAFDAKNYSEAFELLKPFADAGDAAAQFVAGHSYLNKELGFVNDSIAEYYLLQSAVKKYGRAMGLLSVLFFEKSLKEPRFKTDALVWAEIAAAYDPIQKATSTRHLIKAYLTEEELKTVERILKEKKSTFDKIDLASFSSSVGQFASKNLEASSAKTKIPENKLGLMEDPYRDWVYRWKYEKFECESLYYTAKIEEDILDSVIAAIRTSPNFKISTLYSGAKTNALTLTSEEKNYLIAELTKLKEHTWEEGLFPYSKRLEENKIEAVFRKAEKLKTDKEKNLCAIVYTFSRPIYFREGTLSLFLDQKRYRKNYTQLSVDFYVFENNRWQELATAYKYYEHPETKNKRSSGTYRQFKK